MTSSALGLRTFLPLAFAGTTALLTAALSLYSSQQAEAQAREAATQVLAGIARVSAQSLTLGFDERLADLRSLQLNGLPLDAQLDKRHRDISDYTWLGHAGADGRVRVASGDLWEGGDVSRQGWYTSARQRAAVTPAGNNSQGPAAHLFSLALPLTTADGRANGVLVAQLGDSWISKRMDISLPPARQATGIRLFVQGADGRAVHSPSDVSGTLATLPAGEQAQTLRWPDGVEALSVAIPLANERVQSGWRVIARQPLAQVLAPAQTLRNTLLMGSAVLTLLAALIGYGLALFLGRPLRALAAATTALPRADAAARVPAPGRLHEAGLLGDSLNQLLADRESHQAALTKRNAALEAQVMQQTTAIGNATHQLALAKGEHDVLVARLREQASTDALTGLLNRRAFHARAGLECTRAQRQQSPLCVLSFDIDHFKVVNSTHGRDAGDAVLKALADTCRQTLREIDVLARFDGEEFVGLLPDTYLPAAIVAAERLRQAVEATVVAVADGELHFTISIGVARVDAEKGIEAALKTADSALYIAKHKGRNLVMSV
ncbi:MAG: diguanylate cyclase [Moraxellaceae bacterium]|nr:diguanylate cyclase [Moraxellaceae bacterium]